MQRLLAAGANLPAFVHDLLTTQAIVVAGTEAAAFAVERGENDFTLRLIDHLRPDQAGEDVRTAAVQAFAQILRPAVSQGKDAAIEVGPPMDGSDEPQYCLATILRNEEQIVAVTAVITRCLNFERAQQRLMPMSLVAGYFELYSMRRSAEQAKVSAQNHQNVLQLATAVATAEGFESAAMNLCNELATRTGAGRVALGWIKGHAIRVKALSHTEKFDKKQELIVQLERAMEECWDQQEPVQFDPAGSTPNVTRAHRELTQRQGDTGVLSLPLRHKDRVVGVVTLEFAGPQRPGEQAIAGLTVAADLLASQLLDRHDNDRWLAVKAAHSLRENARLLLGPRHMLAKLVVALVLAMALMLVFYQPMYRVKAAFQFLPEEKRSISAPFNGQIDTLGLVDGREVRPGMLVKKGQVLLTMDTYELTRKRIDALSRANSYRIEADNYRQQGKTAEEKSALARRDAAVAEAELYAYQIAHASLTAPVDGVILKNDLRDKKGAMVNQGDVLLEIADAHKLRAELNVAERDVQDVVKSKQMHGGWVPGELATTSLPTQRFAFRIDRIVPLGEAKDGDNYFKVYATLQKAEEAWLPGMAGEARVDIRPRALGWVWTHRLVDFIRLKLWI